MKKSFWQFPPYSKLDVLDEGDHYRHVLGALSDQETGIESVNKTTYILYGKEQALLFAPAKLVVKLSLELYRAYLSLKRL